MSKKLRLAAVALAAAVIGTLACTVAYAWNEGDRVYVVRTGSMAPTYRPGDLVLDRPTSAGYRVGQPVTVQISAAGDLVSHRLVSIDKRGLLHTKGDANPTPDAWALPPAHVRGVVQRVLPKLGYVLVFLRQRQGVFGVMTSAIAVFLLWGLCFPATAEVESSEKAERPPRLRIPRQRQRQADAVVPVPAVVTAAHDVRQPVTTIAEPAAPAEPRIPQPRGPRA